MTRELISLVPAEAETPPFVPPPLRGEGRVGAPLEFNPRESRGGDEPRIALVAFERFAPRTRAVDPICSRS